MITEKYANCYLYSDIDPYQIVRVISDKSIEVKPMRCTRNFKPSYIPGGFAGICINQDDQEWIIEESTSEHVIRLRKRKDGHFYKGSMRFKLSNVPIKYYDFNF